MFDWKEKVKEIPLSSDVKYLFSRSALDFDDNGVKKGVKGVVPGNFVAAGHGEQPFTLKNPVPSLDSVTGANWDGAFP